jgi:hypothetical protein
MTTVATFNLVEASVGFDGANTTKTQAEVTESIAMTHGRAHSVVCFVDEDAACIRKAVAFTGSGLAAKFVRDAGVKVARDLWDDDKYYAVFAG